MEGLLQQLLSEAGDPSARVKGVPDSFFDGLERIPRNKLKKVISEIGRLWNRKLRLRELCRMMFAVSVIRVSWMVSSPIVCKGQR